MRVVKGDFVAKGLFDVSVPLSSLYTYMFAGLCASLAGVASQAGDADSSRAPGLTSGSWTETGVLACTLQFTVILKNPAKCLWRWEPDRRNNFFGPPAHLCRHMWLKYRCIWRKTPIFFCLNKTPWWAPIVLNSLWFTSALGVIFFVFERLKPRLILFENYREKRANCSSRLPLDQRFLECPAPLLCFVFIMLVCWHVLSRQMF